MNPIEAAEIEAAITDMLARLCPMAKGRTMYGGTMFETQPGVPKTGFCGVFSYQNHVSLEFSNGAALGDPQAVLEGKGKFRRHIKLRTMAEIAEKSVEDYLGRAISV